MVASGQMAFVRSAPMGSMLLVGVGIVAATAGCHDLSSYSTAGDHYDGRVVQADFVRAGVGGATMACLTIDADHLQDAPGAISTSDGRFHAVALRSIPQIWHDPLSTLSFGEGRLRSLLYIATASVSYGDAHGDDVLVVVSLMQAGDVEVRLIRGAPDLPTESGAAPSSSGSVFAVFDLTRKPGPCSY
ncbi:MAG: hypothetical protein M3O46_05505 [Myxococcota bacterium]|nr:hypothetical protein [Myxococcota bacterium]